MPTWDSEDPDRWDRDRERGHDRHRDGDRRRHRHSEHERVVERDGDKEGNWERERESRDGDWNRDRDRGRDRDRHRDRDRDRDYERERERRRKRSRSRSLSRGGDWDPDRDRQRPRGGDSPRDDEIPAPLPRLPPRMSEMNLAPPSIEGIDSVTLQKFQQGTFVRKPPNKKANLKRQEEEEQMLAAILSEYSSEFDASSKEAQAGKAFVKGSTYIEDGRTKVAAGAGQVYNPAVVAAAAAAATAKPAPPLKPTPPVAPATMPNASAGEATKAVARVIITPTAAPKPAAVAKPAATPDVPAMLTPAVKKEDVAKRGGKVLDKFLEELKQRSAARDAGLMPLQRNRSPTREPRGGSSASGAPPGPLNANLYGGIFSDPHNECDDPFTTNLYVGNLSPAASEELLVKEFGRHGAIASVKIMWPHTEEERSRQRNCGFVCFMDREDAQEAMDALQGKDIMGYELCLGWGRTVSKPVTPLYVPPHKANKVKLDPSLPRIHVPALFDPLVDHLADHTAKFGVQFEQVIKTREVDNSHFGWLFQPFSDTNPQLTYYKWRVYSLLQGDKLDSWRVAPFQMFIGGPVWIPPAIPTVPLSLKRAQTAPKVIGPTNPVVALPPPEPMVMSNEDSEEFFNLLRGLTSQRAAVRNAMVFAMDRTQFAADVVDFLSQALTLDETPAPSKLARLFLVSDILYNSGNTAVKGASGFRRLLESQLPIIFQSFHNMLLREESASKAKLQEQVLQVLQVWQKWSVYPIPYLESLKRRLLTGAR